MSKSKGVSVKRTAKTPAKGLGDVVANITSAIGIEPCEGCEQRKERLNRLFPFGTEPLNEDQKAYLQDFFSVERTEVNVIQQKELLNIYTHAFRIRQHEASEICQGCPGVWLNIIKKLKKLDYQA